MCVSASLVCGRLKSVCQCLWLICWICVCVCVGVCISVSVCMRWCQRLWQVCRFRAAVLLTLRSRSPLSGRQARPSPQSQRWNSSNPWVPFLRWRVHTWPSDSTGLQMRDQKCLAQHRLSEQSADLRQVSPSWPADGRGIKVCYTKKRLHWKLRVFFFWECNTDWLIRNRTLTFCSMRLIAVGSMRLLGMMLHRGVVFVPAGDDECVHAIDVICLANTYNDQRKLIQLGSVLATASQHTDSVTASKL